MGIKKPSIASVKRIVQHAMARAAEYRQKRPHRSFRRTIRARQKLGGQPLPSARHLLIDSWRFVAQEKKLFLSLGLIYAAVTFLVVGSISQLDLLGLKEVTQETFSGGLDSLGTATALFTATIFGTIATSRSELQQFLAVFLGFLLWLAVVWTARMRLAGKAVKLREALYNCAGPLIPSFLLFLVIVLQLVPGTVGIFLITVAQTTGLLQSGVEVMAFSVGALLLCILSVYWVSASLLALVVVTLPNMYPWRALSTASQLVIGQRWALALRLAVLVVIVFIAWAVVLYPTFLLEGWLKFDWLPIVPIVVQLLSAVTLVYGSVYVYRIYRSLL
ncbi:MAG TPA: hypothetical protein VFT87_05440 [Candidatus Saccharimonadales bacterium]|nr:hypothetical protein [Candidatus Saccharimonadales bacterium]